ncbi:Equisetin cluster transcription factor eqxF, partial [Lachnellula suecica]
TYVGATHWAAILEDIEEVKDYFANADEPNESREEDVADYTTLTLNPYSAVTKEWLIGMLPERTVVDRLVAGYFNSHSPSLNLVHRPTFQKQYKEFWIAPNEVAVIWIGLLYALMALAAFASLGAGGSLPDIRNTPMEVISTYKNCCMQALILSHYTKPGPFTIETLIMYMEVEFLATSKDQTHLYLLVGNVVRLSLRMGLHRDASKVGGNITPFQAEMRRRVWHHISQIDLLASFHIGLPGMVEDIESDTLYPRNLRDEDFGEDSTELPPSRPDSELTRSSYMICKSRLCHVCGKIASLANRLTTPPYDEVMRMDGLLHEAYANVPSFFKIPAEFSIVESPELMIKQFSLALVYQKSRCMLHRKFFMKESENKAYIYSKEAALDASMELLRYQCMSYEATLPSGPLFRDRWVLSTLIIHDFLLASMIISIDIIQAVELSSRNGANTGYRADLKKVKALEKSYNVFMEMRKSSPDAKKASTLLKVMLNKVSRALRGPPVSNDTFYSGSVNLDGKREASIFSGLALDGPTSNNFPKVDVSNQDTWPITGSNDTAPSSGLGKHFDHLQASVPSVAADPLGAMIDIPDEIDWASPISMPAPKDFASGEYDQEMFNSNTI